MDAFRPADVSDIAVEEDTLKGCLITFLDHGTNGKAALEGLVKRLGGQIAQSFMKRCTTHLISSGSGIQFDAYKRSNHSIILIEWLLECESRGARVPLMPRHWAYLPSDAHSTMPGVNRYGDRIFDEVTAADVEALVKRHVSMDDIDTAKLARALRSTLAPDSSRVTHLRSDRIDQGAVMALVEAHLAAEDKATLQGVPFLGANVCAVRLTPSRHASPDTVDVMAAALSRASRRRLLIQVRLGGGRCSDCLTDATSHLVLLNDESSPASREPVTPSPLGIMEAVEKQAGGQAALQLLLRCHSLGNLSIVTERWVISNGETTGFSHPLPDINSWPWARFRLSGAQQSSSRAGLPAKRTRRRVATSKAGASSPAVSRQQPRRKLHHPEAAALEQPVSQQSESAVSEADTDETVSKTRSSPEDLSDSTVVSGSRASSESLAESIGRGRRQRKRCRKSAAI